MAFYVLSLCRSGSRRRIVEKSRDLTRYGRRYRGGRRRFESGHWSRGLFPEHLFAGSYLAIAAIQVLQHSVPYRLCVFRCPLGRESRRRPVVAQIARDPRFVIALVGAVASWAVMSLLMNATPLSMHRHMHSFDDTAWVISGMC